LIKKSKIGFSLIELVLAVMILSVVILAAYSVLITGLKVYNRNSISVEEQRTLRTVFMKIDNDMRSYDGEMGEITVSGSNITIGNRASYDFVIDDGSITRTADATTAVLAEGISAFTASIEGDSIVVEITGENDGMVLKSQIKLRNSVDS
jgi:prepilin-type N-terminal cleavage/methylation domain-containing protein